MNEGLGAVDRVEDPAKTARARLLGKFLAENAVVGKRGGDALPQVLFGAAIGYGHRRIVAF